MTEFDGQQCNARTCKTRCDPLTLKNSVEDQSEKPLKLTEHSSALDEIHRIIPIGLTFAEARAWYLNRVLIPRLRWALAGLIAGAIILGLMFTETGQALEQSLTTHMMVRDLLLLVSGFLLAYGANSILELASQFSDTLRRARAFLNAKSLGGHASSILTLGLAALLIAFWYLPAQFNAAVANLSYGNEMCLTMIIAGSLIFVGARFLSKRVKLIALVIVGKAMGLYGMFLLLTPQSVYSVYPNYEQLYAGSALLFLMLILDFTIMPLWLYSYFRKASGSSLVKDNIHLV